MSFKDFKVGDLVAFDQAYFSALPETECDHLINAIYRVTKVDEGEKSGRNEDYIWIEPVYKAPIEQPKHGRVHFDITKDSAPYYESYFMHTEIPRKRTERIAPPEYNEHDAKVFREFLGV